MGNECGGLSMVPVCLLGVKLSSPGIILAVTDFFFLLNELVLISATLFYKNHAFFAFAKRGSIVLNFFLRPTELKVMFTVLQNLKSDEAFFHFSFLIFLFIARQENNSPKTMIDSMKINKYRSKMLNG